MLRKIIKPKFLYDLERLGGNNDGGYLVEKGSLENSLYLLSFGIGSVSYTHLTLPTKA